MEYLSAAFRQVTREEWLELAAMGIDLSFLLLFRYWYKKHVRSAEAVEGAPSFLLDETFKKIVMEAPGSKLDYVSVEGKVKAEDDPLASRYDNTQGVLRKTVFTEMRSKRDNNIWHDANRTIRDTTDQVPFSLIGKSNKVLVTQPGQAEYLSDSFMVTHDRFEPSKSSLWEKSMDRIFGEITKGFQETEKMLPVGVTLLGFGQVHYEPTKGLMFGPPSESLEGVKYILTKLSKPEILSNLRSTAKVLQFFLGLFGVIGVSLLARLIYKRVQSVLREYELQRQIQQLRELNQVGEGIPMGGDRDHENCVICMANRRNFIILDCGHLCLCADCAQAAQQMGGCPVCRAPIRTMQAVFHP